MTPSAGVEYTTTFSLTASNWSDIEGDYPLQYQLGYRIVGQDTVFDINSGSKSTSLTYSFKLPGGTSDKGNQIEIIVFVYDALDSVTNYSTFVNVTQLEDRSELYAELASKISAINSSNEEDAISALQKAKTFLTTSSNKQAIYNLSKTSLDCNYILCYFFVDISSASFNPSISSEQKNALIDTLQVINY